MIEVEMAESSMVRATSDPWAGKQLSGQEPNHVMNELDRLTDEVRLRWGFGVESAGDGLGSHEYQHLL